MAKYKNDSLLPNSMHYLRGEEEKAALSYIAEAAKEGQKAYCLRSRCGSVIVKDGLVIGSGFNSPPGNKPLEQCKKDSLPSDFKSDKTCCVHAEQRAIMDALAKNPDKINGSRLYFIRLDKDGQIMHAGEPYCTICSKMALDAGVSEFVLWHKEGIAVYDTKDYNERSFAFRRTAKQTGEDAQKSEGYKSGAHIEKKIHPQYFEKVASGQKTFEVRLGNFECKEGDILLLREWDPKTGSYTGRQIEKQVVYIAKTKRFDFWPEAEVEKHGFVILGIR